MDQQTTSSNSETPGIGHNAKPDPVATLKAYLAATYGDLPARVQAIVAKLPELVEIKDQKRADDVTDFAKKQVIALQDDIDKKFRVDEKKPYLDAGRAVDEFFNPLKSELEKVIVQCRTIVTAWNKKKNDEAAAAAAAEANKKLEEAKAAGDKNAVKAAKAEVAAAADVKAEPTRGTHGATASNRKVWKYRIVKADKVPREYCSPDDKLIKAAMKAAGDNVGKLKMAGVEFYEEEQASFRG